MPQLGFKLQGAFEEFPGFFTHTKQISNSPYVKTHSQTERKDPENIPGLELNELLAP
jgi:hypothetical protein